MAKYQKGKEKWYQAGERWGHGGIVRDKHGDQAVYQAGDRWGYRDRDNKENKESLHGSMTVEVRAAHRKKTPDVVIDCDLAEKMTVTSLE